MGGVGDLFDDWARRGRAEGMETGHSQTAGAALEALPLHAGQRFLDLGCGNGWACRHAARQGAQGVGVDLSIEMVARARAASAGLDPMPVFEQADFAELPLPDGGFDVAWSMEAIYYAADVDAVLQEAHRVLRPGATVHLLLDYYAENPQSHGWPAELGVAMQLRGEPGWLEALGKAGFREVASRRLRSEDPDAEAWKREHGSLYLVTVA